MSAVAGVASIYRYTFRRSAGVHATGWARAVPIATILIAFVPAVVAVGVPALLERFVATTSSPIALDRIRALAADPSFVPSSAQYLFVISAVILVAAAYAAAEAVANDGERALRAVYRRSPVGGVGYLVAKSLAVASALLLVSAGPLALLLVGSLLNGQPVTPVDGARALLGAAVVVCPYAAMSLLVATAWPRRAMAAGITILALTAGSAIAGFVASTTGASGWQLVDLRHVPLDLAARLFGQPAAGDAPSTGALAAAVVAVTVASLLATFAVQRRRGQW